MKTKRAVKVFALAVLMPMLILAFAVTPAQAKGPDVKTVDNVKVDSYMINVDDLVSLEQKQMLAEVIPSEFVPYLAQIQYIQIDGTAHLNMMISEKNGIYDIKLHVNWHGTISLLNINQEPLVALDSKNMQLVSHFEVPVSGDVSQSDIWLNLHTNSQLVVFDGTDSMPVELKVHIIMTFSEGQFDLIKVQLPQFADVQLV
jgi:hypothetical protein